MPNLQAISATWALLIALSTAIYSTDASRLIPTTSGAVKGHLAANGSRVIEYLGIPFAKPPVADLRFEPPQRFEGNGTFEASEFGFDCPAFTSPPYSYPGLSPQAQDILANFASITGDANPQSEDCLTLNIWTRATAGAHDGAKPVVVFFYGGRFSIGASHSAMYTGKYIAELEDVVIVTANYRLNVFGFPGAPGQPQNLGLRDQRMAVEWVHENIAGFGGDPEKITIIGQSAGGVSVDYWAYAYREDPIVKGIWAISGNAFSFPPNSPKVAADNWGLVVDAVNCTSAADPLECVRAVDWKNIRDVALQVPNAQSSNILRSIAPFWPVQDDEVVLGNYLNLTHDGLFAKIPTIFSNTHNEEGYYQIPALRRSLIPNAKDVDNFMLESFTCPNSFQARQRVKKGVPSWYLRYFGDWQNTRLYSRSGAYHGVDLHMIFGASEDVTGLPPSDTQAETTRLMQRALVAFANDPANGLSKDMGWPQFDEAKRTLVLLAVDNDPKPRMVFPRVYDVFCNNVTMGAMWGQKS